MAEARLKERGLGEEEIQKTIKAAEKAAEEASSAGFYSAVVNPELKALESVIFASGDGDVAMGDGAAS